MEIRFERAKETDAESLVRVQVLAFHHDSKLYPEVEIGGPPGYDSVDVMIQRIRDADYYTMRTDNRCIGGMVIFSMGKGHYHLGVIFIDPDYHNKGIGTQAMQFIEKTYPTTLWTLDTPQWAIRNQHFYEKLGYKKVREFEEEDGTPIIAYEKRITPA